MKKKKRLLFEIGFFVFYFIILQLATEVQYKFLLAGYDFQQRLSYHLLVTPVFALPYFFYYKRQVPLLFEKRYIPFALSVFLFILFLECYLLFIDWYTFHNPLLSAKVRETVARAKNEAPFPRQMISLTVTHLLTLTGLGYFLKKIDDEKKLRQLKEQHLQLELHYLKAQLHPHFLFNTLNNIYSLALDASSQTAATVARLADLMRYILYEGSQQKVLLEKEIAFLSNYVALQKIRHNSSRTIDFTVKGKTEGILIEPLLFIPLIENGFKHGIHNALENGWLKAVLLREEGWLCFEVENSLSNAAAPSKGGVGLTNLRKRLQLLYPGKHAFEARHGEHSFKAVLKLNLQ